MTASGHSTTSIACTSIARQATTGASEIERSIPARSGSDTQSSLPSELQALQTLATKLRQLATSATQLGNTLDGNSSASPSTSSSAQSAARDALRTGLTDIEAVASTVVKQLMRCGPNPPAQRISLAAVLTYDHFASTAGSFLSLVTSMMTRSSQQQSNPSRDAADIDTLLARVSGACADVSSCGGILLDGGLGNATQPVSLLDTDNDVVPPVYEMRAPSHDAAHDQPPPPSFEASSRNLSDSGYEDWDGDKKDKYPPHDDNHTPAYTPGAWGQQQKSSNGDDKNQTRLTKPPSPKRGFFTNIREALRITPEPLVVALCEAATRGEVGQMRSLVAQGVNLNGRNEHGRTALICAVLADQPESVVFLIGNEARADATVCDDVGLGLSSSSRGKYGKPPLYHAVETQNMHIAELLLSDQGAGGHRLAGQKDDYGQSFFSRCVLAGNVPVKPWLEMLLSHGADASAKDLTGRPLVLAVLGSSSKRESSRRDDDVEEIVSLLLKHGASPSSKDDDGTALLHRAVEQGRTKLALQLVNMGADPNGKDVSGSPVLLAALKKGERELVKALLERGADPNVKDLYGSRLLAVVQKTSSLRPEERDAMTTLLLEHGARK